MTPDVQQYVPLPLVQKDPQDIFASAVAQGRLSIPGWSPREGNVEVVLLELMALQVAEAVYSINQLPNSVVYVMLQLFGIYHDEGEAPTVNLKFTLSSSNGFAIPQGTAVRYIGPDGNPIVFVTDNELVIPNGSTIGTVAATAATYTATANGMAVGTQGTLLDAISYVNYVEFDTSPTGGRNKETDYEYFTRGIQKFQRLTSTLVLPHHFTSAILEYEDVERAHTLDNYNPANDPDNNGPVGNDAGHVTIAAYGSNEFLSAPRKAELATFLSPMALANLSIHVVDPTINTVNVTSNIRVEPGYSTTDVVAAVVANLRSFLDADSWDWDTVVRLNELISIITNTDGVDYVDQMVTPTANVTLTGVAPLANAGTINIQVV